MGEVRIGAQGWNYDDWIGAFYPRGTRAADSLDLYVKAFDTVEADSTFYAIPSEAAVRSWASRAPDGFTYSLKLPRQITHEQRLRDCAEVLEQFCQRAKELGEKLGSVLIQLPPDFSPHSWGALESFIPLLPHDMRFAVEFRDQAWVTEPVVKQLLRLLSEYKVALALVDGKWIDRDISLALIDRQTAPFAYVRWMGLRVLTQFSHVQIDRDRELSQWADAFAVLRQRVEVIYGYFNNHYQGHSPASANQLKRLVGEPVIEPESLIVQPSLF